VNGGEVRKLKADDPAARALASEKARRALAPFLNEARSLSEAARLAGFSRQALRYWVRKLEVLGLVERVQDSPPRWRATATAFLIPFAADPASAGMYDWLERRQAREHQAMLRAAAHQLEELGLDHLLLYARGSEPVTSPASADGQAGREAGLLDGFAGVLELSDADAAKLRRELAELWRRYAGCRGRGRRLRVYAYLVAEPLHQNDLI